MATESNDEMTGKAVESIVQNGLLVRVKVFADAKEKLSLLLCPNTSVPGLKTEICKHVNVPEVEQRLSVDDEVLLDGTLQQVASEAGDVKVDLKRVALDPLLLSLYNMVGLGNWKERDEIMARMSRPRNAWHCNRGHPLVGLSLQDETRLTQTCAKCHTTSFDGHTYRGRSTAPVQAFACVQCQFCLCSQCMEADNGFQDPLKALRENVRRFEDQDSDVQDPHKVLEIMALDIGRKMAQVGGWFGGRGHMCGFPSIDYNTEFAPRRFQKCWTTRGSSNSFRSRDSFRVGPTTKILHDGAKLFIRFQPEARAFLASAGLQKAMLELELEQICENGITTREMVKLRGAWNQAPNSVYNALIEEWKNRVPAETILQGSWVEAHPTTSLVSFGIETVVYEIGVRATVTDGDY